MEISIFHLFKIGIGPSSSHTVGPMAAAYRFIRKIKQNNINMLQIDLYGSLALTGLGHATDKAVLLGLEGNHPSTVDPDYADKRFVEIKSGKTLNLNKQREVNYEIRWHTNQTLPRHPNGLSFSALDNDEVVATEIYYSVGGGFIVTDEEFNKEPDELAKVPYHFDTASELFTLCRTHNLSIAELILENEKVWHPEKEIKDKILKIANTMHACIERGCSTTGILPGGLNVRRRAPELLKKMKQKGEPCARLSDIMNYLNVFAMAVNEENAAGGKIVTAPTNGAAGIIPAVLEYYRRFCPGSDEDGVITFFLTAGAIAALYKKQASISGAEVGCQGEVGVACSMAAGALAAALGGTLQQVENAAEIGMEHNLGLTCDPVNGLVQVPCIERNAMGAIKAVNAAGIALMEDLPNLISLEKVIATMKQTGHDMQTIYKETSLGGLAANIPEC